MLHRLRKRARTARFNLSARGVLGTAPLALDPASGVTFLSQICHRDRLMYLLAVKSLGRFLPPAAVTALDDGSLTRRDRRILRAHIPGIEIRPVSAIDTGPCPRGGTWERLLAIHDRAADSFVVQVDADTLTLSEPSEVLDHVRANRSFTLGTSMGRAITTLAEAGNRARVTGPDDRHVQDTAERAFADLPGADRRLYVRGNSGFAGFAAGSHARADLEAFAREMSERIGADKWAQWGSEQVASNYAVANAPGGSVLPYPGYGYFHPDHPWADRPFLHFIGTYRFRDGVYARLARRTVDELRAAEGSRAPRPQTLHSG
ncbi:MAG TPA: hypothetical protein VKA55_09765 [Gammaproteobacteria bacterium]|nr:hypothetical protein [Gammaproteobacteria bacterium]